MKLPGSFSKLLEKESSNKAALAKKKRGLSERWEETYSKLDREQTVKYIESQLDQANHFDRRMIRKALTKIDPRMYLLLTTFHKKSNDAYYMQIIGTGEEKKNEVSLRGSV